MPFKTKHKALTWTQRVSYRPVPARHNACVRIHLHGGRWHRPSWCAQVGGAEAAVEVSQRRVPGQRVRGALQAAEAAHRAVRRPVGRPLCLHEAYTAYAPARKHTMAL